MALRLREEEGKHTGDYPECPEYHHEPVLGDVRDERSDHASNAPERIGDSEEGGAVGGGEELRVDHINELEHGSSSEAGGTQHDVVWDLVLVDEAVENPA